MADQMLPTGIDPNIDFANLYKVPNYAKAHGTLMGLAFVVVYPLGAITIRLVKAKNVVWIHAACQLTGWVLMITGLAMGVSMASILDLTEKNAHTIIGTIVVVALLLQPFIGFIHHRRFMKKQRQSKWTFVHVWYGRVLIILGMINGGLGLQLATDGPAYKTAGMIAYAVIAGISGVAFLSAIAVSTMRKTGKSTEDLADGPAREVMKA